MARTSARDKINTDSLYGSAPVDVVVVSPTPTTTSTKTAAVNNPKLVRKTYYYTTDLVKAISVVAALEGKDKSELVREILMDSRLKEYIEKIKNL